MAGVDRQAGVLSHLGSLVPRQRSFQLSCCLGNAIKGDNPKLEGYCDPNAYRPCVDVAHDGKKLWVARQPQIQAGTLDDMFDLLPSTTLNIIGGPLPAHLRHRRSGARRGPPTGMMLWREATFV